MCDCLFVVCICLPLFVCLQSKSTTCKDAQRSVDIFLHLESNADDAFQTSRPGSEKRRSETIARSLVCQDISVSSFQMQQHFSVNSFFSQTLVTEDRNSIRNLPLFKTWKTQSQADRRAFRKTFLKTYSYQQDIDTDLLETLMKLLSPALVRLKRKRH